MGEPIKRWHEIVANVADDCVSKPGILIGYYQQQRSGTPILWRGYPRRDPPLVTYQQWREFLLSVKTPSIYFEGCNYTGEAFIQCVELDFIGGSISPAEFRGQVFRKTKEGPCFLDHDMPIELVYGSD